MINSDGETPKWLSHYVYGSMIDASSNYRPVTHKIDRSLFPVHLFRPQQEKYWYQVFHSHFRAHTQLEYHKPCMVLIIKQQYNINNDIKCAVNYSSCSYNSWSTKYVLAYWANVHLTLTISIKMHPLPTVWVCALYPLLYQLAISKIILIQSKTGSTLTAGNLCFL